VDARVICKRVLSTEDQRKLHAEINQLLNQRFLLTTTAITVFGVFSAFMIPKGLNQGSTVVGHVMLGGTSYLLLFILLLFLWNQILANLQSTLGWYLILKNESEWEKDFRKYTQTAPLSMRLRSTAPVDIIIFYAIGALSTCWPFAISIALGICLETGWVLFLLTIAVLYFILVLLLSVLFRRNQAHIKATWEKTLGIKSPDRGESDEAKST